jgi:hypothetical protein
VKCSRDTLDGFGPERVDADKSTAHAENPRTDPTEVRGEAFPRADSRALAISKGVVAKYVARIERTGLEPGVLISMSDVEVMARIAPAVRPVNYGSNIDKRLRIR